MTTHTKRISAGAGAAVLLVALLAGCGNDGSRSGVSVEEFCAEAQAIIDDDIGDVDTTDSEAVDAGIDRMVEKITSLEAPAEIAEDWEIVTDALGQYVTTAKGVDINSDTAGDDLAEITELMTSEKYTKANANVEAYTTEHCAG